MNQPILILAISIVVLAAVIAPLVLKRMKQRHAHAWPSAAGQVESTSVRLESRGNMQSAFAAEVDYSYAVEGATFSGRLRRDFMRKNSADKWVGNYKNGLPLTVRYNPKNSKDSVLLESDQAGAKV